MDSEIMGYLMKQYCNHCFDILGSGWVPNRLLQVRGLDGHKAVQEWIMSSVLPAHCEYGQYVASQIEGTYEPLDWQLDVKSGHRWSAAIPSYHCVPVFDKGVDIKVPWEFTRFQHFPQMVVGALLDEPLRVELVREFKNQVCDFIATNPPGMGVNWVCTMDVAIRVANLLLSNDLFRQLDREGILDELFQKTLANSILDHCEHIVNHLERSEIRPNNHYLANLAGLLFVVMYLEGESRIAKWKEFAIEEFHRQVESQFNEDGSSIEFSTSYHRLSGEMVVYSVALLLRTNRIEIRSLAAKIRGIIDFTVACMKPSGRVPQIGDNDNGRFFRLTPLGRFTGLLEWEEDFLDHRAFVSAGEALFRRVNMSRFRELELEFSLVRALCGDTVLQSDSYKTRGDFSISGQPIHGYERYSEMVVRPDGRYLTDQLRYEVFPDFGLIVFRSSRLFLSICFGPVTGIKFGGHAHDDFAAFECVIDGKEIACDAGTYVYTPNCATRNAFRNRTAHNGLWSHELPARWWRHGPHGLFEYADPTTYSIAGIEADRVEIRRSYRRVRIGRMFQIQKDRIVITDRSNRPLPEMEPFPYYSSAYGRIGRTEDRMQQ